MIDKELSNRSYFYSKESRNVLSNVYSFFKTERTILLRYL